MTIWVDAIRPADERPVCRCLLPRFLKRHVGEASQRDAGLLAVQTIAETPKLVALRCHPEDQTVAVGDAVGFGPGAGGFDFADGERRGEYIAWSGTFNVLKNVLVCTWRAMFPLGPQ